MSLRIPIIPQTTSLTFTPQQRVQALQISDPRGQALQGLGSAIGEFGEGVTALNARNDADQAAREKQFAATADSDDQSMGAAMRQAASGPSFAATTDGDDTDQGAAFTAAGFTNEQDNRLQAVQNFTSCLAYGTDLATHLHGRPSSGAMPVAANDGAAPPAAPNDATGAPSPVQAMASRLLASLTGGGINGALIGSGTNSNTLDSDGGNGAPPPDPRTSLDPGVAGPTGAWVNGYDLAAQSAVNAAPSPEAARDLAAPLAAARRAGAAAMLTGEAQANLAQRRAGFTASVDALASRVLAANPALLPDVLGFVDRNMIATGEDSAAFRAQVHGTLIGASVKSLIARDPEGVVRSLEAHDGDAGDRDSAPYPELAVLTPQERTAYLPQARAGVAIAQSGERAGAMQEVEAAIRGYQTGTAPDALPDAARLTRLFGEDHARRLMRSLTDARDERWHYDNYQALPSAELKDMLARGREDGATATDLEADAARRATSRLLAQREFDPVNAAQKAGAYGLQPADVGSAQTALAAAGSRAAVAGLIARDYETRPALFSGAEAQGLAQLAAGLPAEQRGPFFAQLAQSIGDPGLTRATLAQIGDEDPVLAAAARLQLDEQDQNPAAAGKLNAPRYAFEGYALLNPAEGKAFPMPGDGQMRGQALPEDMQSGNPAQDEARHGLARAIYAAMARQDGDVSGTLDPQRWYAARWMAAFGSGTAGEVGLTGAPVPVSSSQFDTTRSAISPGNPLATSRGPRDLKYPDSEPETTSDVELGSSATPNLAEQPVREAKDQYALMELAGSPIPDVGSTSGLKQSTGENGPLRFAPSADPPHEYVRRVLRNVANPPPGTSNDAVKELPKRYPEVFQQLIKEGAGSTTLNNPRDYKTNGFKIPQLPEEYTNDPEDLTHHEYGVLTYLGPVDSSRGITKDKVVELLVDRRSRPGNQLHPIPSAFSVYGDVYSTHPTSTIANDILGSGDTLKKPENYTYPVGSIAQTRVPDGVVNITASDHKVYPGTIRRTILEVDGHLFAYTQGSGENRLDNKAILGVESISQFGGPVRTAAERQLAAFGNGKYGREAFKMVDQGLFDDVQRLREGRSLEPVDMTPVRLPPAFTPPSNPRRGTE